MNHEQNTWVSSAARELLRRPALVGLLLLFTAAAVTAGPVGGPPYSGAPGPWALEEARQVWRDSARSRDIPVHIFVPARDAGADEPLPAVVMSPGYGETRDSYDYLAAHLASHGYAVVVAQHPGSDREAYERRRSGASRGPTPENYALRPADLSFCIDHLTGAADGVASPLLEGRVDSARIGVAGHSLGSTTALTLGGLTAMVPDDPRLARPDQRVRAVLAMSPQIATRAGMRAGVGLHPDSWSTVDVPVMMMTGTADRGVTADTQRDPHLVRRSAFDGLGTSTRYYVVLEEAEHHAFTETPPLLRGGPRDPAHHDYIEALATAFFDAWVRDSKAARDWLSSAAPAQMAGGGLEMIRAAGVDGGGGERAVARDPAGIDFSRIERYLEDALSTRRVRGAGLSILGPDGALWFEETFGDWSMDTPVPVASASKWWTAATIMTLVDDGLVSLDDPVAQYLPPFRDAGAKSRITLRQTLAFTTGLPSHDRVLDDPGLTLEQAVERIAQLPLEAEPGEGFIYGGTHMALAARVAEVVTGRPYREVFETRLLEPLGVQDTRLATLVNRSPRNLDFRSANPFAAGGVVTTQEDFKRFLRMLLDDGVIDGERILSEASVALMMQDQTDGAPILYTPQRDESFRYALGAWYREMDPATGAALVSSEGALGTSPWLSTGGDYAVLLMTQARPGQVKDVVWELEDRLYALIEGGSPPVAPPAGAGAAPGEGPAPRRMPPARGGGRSGMGIMALDRNGDGILAREEVPEQMTRLRQIFDSADQDGDGELDAAELERLQSVIDRFGRDRPR